MEAISRIGLTDDSMKAAVSERLRVEKNSGNVTSSRDHICKICFVNIITCVILPCGHLVACNSCAEKLSRCPFDRKAIKV
jgi:hypothetical protein